MKENQKADISSISSVGCLLYVIWEVILCRKGYLLSGLCRYQVCNVDDEHDNDEYLRIRGKGEGDDRDMP